MAAVYVLIAVVAGVLIGLIARGKLRGIGEAQLRWLPALMVAAALQVGAIVITGSLGVAAILASYVALIAFTLANLQYAGMGVVAIGVLMNFAVIAVNGGMPVRATAIKAAGIAASNREIAALEFTSKRHLERPGDDLMPLADIIPLPLPFGLSGQVLSFGDLVMSVGVADVIVHLMRRPRTLSSLEPEATASTGSD